MFIRVWMAGKLRFSRRPIRIRSVFESSSARSSASSSAVQRSPVRGGPILISSPSAPAQQRGSLLHHHRRHGEIADNRERQHRHRHPNPVLQLRLHRFHPRSRGQPNERGARAIVQFWLRCAASSEGNCQIGKSGGLFAGRCGRLVYADLLKFLRSLNQTTLPAGLLTVIGRFER
jgi:hypothetical protein